MKIGWRGPPQKLPEMDYNWRAPPICAAAEADGCASGSVGAEEKRSNSLTIHIQHALLIADDVRHATDVGFRAGFHSKFNIEYRTYTTFPQNIVLYAYNKNKNL